MPKIIYICTLKPIHENNDLIIKVDVRRANFIITKHSVSTSNYENVTIEDLEKMNKKTNENVSANSGTAATESK